MIRISIFYTMIFLFIGTHQLWGQAPPVQWIKMYGSPSEPISNSNSIIATSKGNDGVFSIYKEIKTVISHNIGTIYYNYFLMKHGKDGEVFQKSFYSGSTLMFASLADKREFRVVGGQDGGCLVLNLGNYNGIDNYDANGNLKWSNTQIYSPILGTATLSMGFYVLNNEGSLYKLASNGTIEWGLKGISQATQIKSVKTTPDDGVLVITSTKTQKYNSKGLLQWENAIGGSKILIADSNVAYILTSTGVIKFNIIDGTRTWAYAQNDIVDAVVTEDKGCVILTTQKSIRLTSDGQITWTNIYGGNSLSSTLDNSFLINNGSSVVKVSANNKVLWEKLKRPSTGGFSGSISYESVFTTPDDGILIYGTMAGYGQTKTNPFVYKLAQDIANNCNLVKLSLGSTETQTIFCKQTISNIYPILGNIPITDPYATYILPSDIDLEWASNDSRVQGMGVIGAILTQTSNITATLKQQGGCTITSPSFKITILSATKPIVTSNRSQICQGAEATLIATGCEGNVAWSTGGAATSNQIVIKPQPNTFYYATCESNFIQNGTQQVCRSETSSNLSFTLVNNNITTSITGDNAVCKGSKTALSSNIQNGVEPFNYSWNTNGASIGQNNKTIDTGTQGDYTVSVIDSRGCSATSATFKLTEKGGDLSALISPVGSTTVITPETVTLNANTGLGLTYIWQKDNQNIPNATTNTFTAKESGSYTVVVSRDGCSLASAPIIVRINQPLAVEELLIENGVVVAPNPTQDRVAISVTLIKPSKLKVSLFSITGQVIQTLGINEVLANHIFNLDLSQYSTGMYLLHIETEDGGTYRKIQKL